MPVSKAQKMVWEIRDQIDREIADMTPEQRRRYFREGMEKAKRELGLNLPVVRAGDHESAHVRP
jgi:hypothetical protein